MKVRAFLRCFLVVAAALTTTTAVAQVSDLTISKSGPAVANADTDVPYDISILNLGPDDSDVVTLTDAIPPGMTFVSLVQNTGPAFSCSDPGVGNNGTVTCTVASLLNGASADFTLTVHIAPATPPGTFFTNIATVTCATDPSTENNSSTAVTSTPTNDADMVVTKTGPSAAAPNSDVSFSITVVNAGPATATNVSLTDTLPGTMTFVSETQNSGPAFSCTTPSVGSGGTITCTIASLTNGTNATFTFTGHIPSGTPSGTIFTNTATVTSDNDPTPENNSSQTAVTVSSSDLSAVKTGPATVIAGQNLVYNLTLANAGPDAAFAARIDDFFPAGTTFVSFVQNTGPAATCLQTGTNTAGCSINALFASGGNATFTLTVFVPVTTVDGTVLTNTAVASSQNFDPNSANDTSTINTTVIGVTDLSVTKSGSATATAGSNISYTITVANNGASPAQSAQLTDTLPANTTFVSEQQNSGPAASCTTPGVGSGGTVTCTWASLAPGASATFTLVVKVASSATGSISNTANVTTTTIDTNPANDSSTSTTTITVSSDVSVTKSGPGVGIQGQNVTYSIVVANAGPSDATTVALTDTIPVGSTFVSLGQSGPVFSCTAPPPGGTGAVNCSIAILASGASTTFTLVVQADTTATTLSNTATVTSASPDPNPANNTSSTTTGLIPIGQVPALSPLLLLLLGAALAAIALMTKR
jgi:uncharacterized repeat protein (TIGR01451 family)